MCLRLQGFSAGKYIEVRLTAASAEAARGRVDSMCDKLLANPVIESYRFDIEKLVSA